MLALVLYAVGALTFAPGMNSDLSIAPDALAGSPPTTVALSRSGSLAVILYPQPLSNTDPQILVIRTDGTRVSLKTPSDSVLNKSFAQYALGPDGEASYPGARFLSIALANDGTPFATVGAPFSGAISGMDRGIFIWNGEHWRDALEKRALAIDTINVTIAAVDVPSRFACNGDYSNTFPIIDEADKYPHYQEYPAMLVDGRKSLSLGYGAATAVRGRFVVGYTAGQRSVQTYPADMRQPSALEWIDGRRQLLGPGAAYSVNTGGNAVGTSLGFPTLWQGGHSIRLSDQLGSAYAIDDNGIIVGQIGDDAFIYDQNGARKMMRIERLVRAGGWHISAAYAIAANGSILAVGQRGSGSSRIVLLRPIRSLSQQWRHPIDALHARTRRIRPLEHRASRCDAVARKVKLRLSAAATFHDCTTIAAEPLLV